MPRLLAGAHRIPHSTDWLGREALTSPSRPDSAVLDTLSEREAGVISMRFGLSGGEPKTLDAIGKVYGVTRERIRQIEDKAMKKLRHPSRSMVLRPYLLGDQRLGRQQPVADAADSSAAGTEDSAESDTAGVEETDLQYVTN